MTYLVQGAWSMQVEEDTETLEAALELARDLSNAHPEAVFQISGPGFQGNVFTPTRQEVS